MADPTTDKIERAPRNYWQSWDGISYVVKSLIDELGHFPTTGEMINHGYEHLPRAVRINGGRSAVMKKIGYKPTNGNMESEPVLYSSEIPATETDMFLKYLDLLPHKIKFGHPEDVINRDVKCTRWDVFSNGMKIGKYFIGHHEESSNDFIREYNGEIPDYRIPNTYTDKVILLYALFPPTNKWQRIDPHSTIPFP